jgi:GTP pyrophosphokinase
MESFRTDLLTDDVYVFTPKGDVIELPRNATPIDFAFRIHSDIGMHCTGAKVNGHIATLKYELKNGDTVEILTSNKINTSKDWLRVVKTSKARSAIMQWVKKEERKRSIDVGKNILEKEFRKRGKSFSKILKSDDLSSAMKSFNLSTAEDLMSAIGFGGIIPKQFFGKLYADEKIEEKRKKPSKIESIIDKISRRQKEAIEIQGIDDILVKYGKCCNPITGDDIEGFITRGRGVTVHKTDCPYILESAPERRIKLQWGKDTKLTRPVKIKVICKDEKGLLAGMSSSITGKKANITSAQINTKTARAVCIFEIAVESLTHLEKVIDALHKVKGVTKVDRIS